MKKAHARALALIPAVIGIGAFLFLNRNRPAPPTSEVSERALPFHVLTLRPEEVRPAIRGFGLSQAARTWRAVARVGGRVTQVHRELQSGARIATNEVLIKIDEAPYRLEIARIEAEIARTNAEFDELVQRAVNDRSSLAIENRSLELAEAELKRLETLHAQGSISDSTLDSTVKTVLTHRQSVLALDSSLSLAPSQKAAKRATIRAQEAELEAARLDLEYTSMRSPFEAILGPVSVQEGQYVSAGEELFEIHGIAQVIIEAEFLYGDGRRILGPEAALRLSTAMTESRLSTEGLQDLFRATVRMTSGTLVVDWEARVVGARELVSSSARAIVLRLAVDEPFAKAIPGKRPALLQGVFCEVMIEGLPLADRLVIPRTAVRNDTVTIVDSENRLRTRAVEIDFEQGEAAVVLSGLVAGDRILVADPGAILSGALIAPIEDEDIRRSLTAFVSGEQL